MLVGIGLVALNVATPPIDWLGLAVGGAIILAGLVAVLLSLRV